MGWLKRADVQAPNRRWRAFVRVHRAGLEPQLTVHHVEAPTFEAVEAMFKGPRELLPLLLVEVDVRLDRP